MSELYCKWVSDNMTTMNDTKWQVGVPKELPKKNDLKLCYPGLFHYIRHPLFAVFFKHSHACNHYTKLYEVVPGGKIIEGLDRCGATKLTLVKELEIPKVALEQRVAFAILCALEVYQEESFVRWANNWVLGYYYNSQPVNPFVYNGVTEFDIYAVNAAINASKAADYYECYTYHATDKTEAEYADECAYYSSVAALNTMSFIQHNNKTIDLFSMMNEAMEVQ